MPRSTNNGTNDNAKRGITTAGGFKLTTNGNVLVNDPNIIKLISTLSRTRKTKLASNS